MNEKLKKSLKSAIYGLAVGDALGVPFEFKQKGSFHCSEMVGGGTWSKPAGTWSDDTSMTLATCDSIKNCKGKIDLGDMRTKFEDWLKEGKYTIDGVFDCGSTTRMAIVSKKGSTSKNSNGNGSLMRILPLAFVESTDEDIENVSAITHGHTISKTCCKIYVQLAKKFLSHTTDFQTEICECFENVQKTFKIHRGEFVPSTGFVVNTLYNSLDCLLNTNSYKECVLKAVNMGGDTDTLAAVTGGLAGIIYGFDNIPQEWIKDLRGKSIIDKAINWN